MCEYICVCVCVCCGAGATWPPRAGSHHLYLARAHIPRPRNSICRIRGAFLLLDIASLAWTWPDGRTRHVRAPGDRVCRAAGCFSTAAHRGTALPLCLLASGLACLCSCVHVQCFVINSEARSTTQRLPRWGEREKETG